MRAFTHTHWFLAVQKRALATQSPAGNQLARKLQNIPSVNERCPIRKEQLMSGLQAKRVLVPFDYSDRCVDAVKRALDIVPGDGIVVAAHVLSIFHPIDPDELSLEYTEKDYQAESEDKMRRMLLDADVHLGNVEMKFAVGNAAKKIAEIASEMNVELIVVPSHGRHGVVRFALGSVAERIARLAPVPVLIVKEDEAA